MLSCFFLFFSLLFFELGLVFIIFLLVSIRLGLGATGIKAGSATCLGDGHVRRKRFFLLGSLWNEFHSLYGLSFKSIFIPHMAFRYVS